MSRDCLYLKIQEMADKVQESIEFDTQIENHTLRLAFSIHLRSIANAIQAIEFVNSGDWAQGSEMQAIKEAILKNGGIKMSDSIILETPKKPRKPYQDRGLLKTLALELVALKKDDKKIDTNYFCEKFSMTRVQFNHFCYRLRKRGYDIPKLERAHTYTKEFIKELDVAAGK